MIIRGGNSVENFRVLLIVPRQTLFTRFSFENERSPLQLLTIMLR